MPYFVVVVVGMVGYDGIEFFFKFLDFAGCYFDVGCLSLGAAHGLVYHNSGVLEGEAFVFLAGYEEYGGHGGGHACADGGYVRVDELHCIVDAEAGVDGATGGVDVDGDVFGGVYRVEVEELCFEGVGCVVVDFCAEEDDAVHHQAGKDV